MVWLKFLQRTKMTLFVAEISITYEALRLRFCLSICLRFSGVQIYFFPGNSESFPAGSNPYIYLWMNYCLQ